MSRDPRFDILFEPIRLGPVNPPASTTVTNALKRSSRVAGQVSASLEEHSRVTAIARV